MTFRQTLLLPALVTGAITHAVLCRARAARYTKRGRALVEKANLLINDLECEPDNMEFVSELNRVALDLGAICADWEPFSVAVFTVTLPMGRSNIRGLRPIFQATLEKLQAQEDASGTSGLPA